MGYRGKLEQRARARELRAQAWTMPEIADEFGVSRSSASLWTRDVPFDPAQRRSARTDRRPRGSDHPLRRRKEAEIAAADVAGRERIGCLDDGDLLIAGAALYAGEGSKGDGSVGFANTNAQMMRVFRRWLRRFFDVDESRLRAQLYLHQQLQPDASRGHGRGACRARGRR